MECCRRIPRPGLFLAAAAATLMAISTVLAGAVIADVDPVLPSAFMYFFLAVLSTPLMLRKSKWMEASKLQWFLAAISGVLSGVYIFTRLESMKYIPPVDTSALTQTQLIFVVILACIWLKEPLGAYEIIFILLITIGAFMVTQPQFVFGSNSTNDQPDRYIGFILALVTAVLSSIMTCIVRSLHTIDPFLIAFLQGVAATVVLLGIYARNNSVPSNEFLWTFIIGGSICGAFTVMFFTLAYQVEQASIVTAISALESIVTMLMQVAILNVIPNWITALGAIFIVIGVMALPMKDQILRKLRSCRPQKQEASYESL